MAYALEGYVTSRAIAKFPAIYMQHTNHVDIILLIPIFIRYANTLLS